jgi:hypothetical protein
MTNHIYALYLGCLLFFFSHCSTFYQSAPTPTPIVKQTGDANIYVSLTDAQLAYAITDNIGVVAVGHLDNRKRSFFSDTSGVIAKLLDDKLERIEAKGYHTYQLGGFYFCELDPTKSLQAGLMLGTYKPSVIIEVDRGLFKKNTDEYLAYKCLKGDVFLNYVHSSKYIDFITSLKFVGIQYKAHDYTEPLVMKQLGKMTADQQPILKSMYFFVEPSLSIQYGFDHFKLRLQTFLSQALDDNKFSKNQMGASLGLNYQFSTQKKNLKSAHRKGA